MSILYNENNLVSVINHLVDYQLTQILIQIVRKGKFIENLEK